MLVEQPKCGIAGSIASSSGSEKMGNGSLECINRGEFGGACGVVCVELDSKVDTIDANKDTGPIVGPIFSLKRVSCQLEEPVQPTKLNLDRSPTPRH